MVGAAFAMGEVEEMNYGLCVTVALPCVLKSPCTRTHTHTHTHMCFLDTHRHGCDACNLFLVHGVCNSYLSFFLLFYYVFAVFFFLINSSVLTVSHGCLFFTDP